MKYNAFLLLLASLCIYSASSVVGQNCSNVACHPFATCTTTNGSAECKCNLGYSGNGTHCLNIDECLAGNRCHINASCIDTVGSFQCHCKPGYTGNGMQCDDVNECAMNAHLCHLNAACVNTLGSYRCQCAAGWQGNGTFCQDVDECKIGGVSSCNSTAAICTNTIGSFKCSCKSGFSGDGRSCKDVNECGDVRLNNCQQNCVNTEGSYICNCFPAFYLNDDKRTCTAFDVCTLPTCSVTGICAFENFRPLCFCSRGYQSQARNTTCADIDECSSKATNKCQQVCNNTAGAYSCSCRSGFKLNSDETTCADVNECTNSAQYCSKNAVCTNTIGSYSCKCNSGFTGDGENCTNINECEVTSSCNKNATCNDTYGSYKCQCKAGFTGDGNACTDIDECKTIMPCGSNEICENTVGSYNCSCVKGFARNASNICVDIDECQSGTSSCHNVSHCINTVGSHKCYCKIGFTGNGTFCEDINECLTNASCRNQSTCKNTYGSYRCLCNPGYERRGNHCVNTNECKRSNRCHSNASCTDTIGSYLCTCKSGFSGDGIDCRDIDECTLSTTCHSFRTCVNYAGSYQCIDYCRQASCPILSTCQNMATKHTCRCKNGHFMAQNTCRRAMRIFSVDNFVLTRGFIPSYAVDTSSSFTILAIEVEEVLSKAFRLSPISEGFSAIQVTKLRKGSVVVSLYVLYANATAVTTEQVEAVLKNATTIQSLNPFASQSPVTKISNLCKVDGHDCGKNSFCVPTELNTNYRCSCVGGFERRDGSCKPKRTYIEIIVPAAIGGFLLLFFVCLLIVLINKRRAVKQTHEIHIEHAHNGGGIENRAVELNNVTEEKLKRMERR